MEKNNTNSRLRIRQAASGENDRVIDFYYDLIDAMEGAEFHPGWEKELYPTREFLTQAVHLGELYIGEMDGKIVSAMVINHSCHETYCNITWSVGAKTDEVYVIHTLGVHPVFAGQGIAGQMVREAIVLAEKKKIKTIRLEVLKGNIPAEKVYLAAGFQYVDEITMYYDDTGWDQFKVFEYIV